jgi:hypothetical protein
MGHVSGSVAGVVRDAAGTPQIGAVVELLRSDSSLAARVFTDRKGVYLISSVLPGQYALKAMGSSFIPTLKQNLHIRANTVVNLTLNSLYDLMQWAPHTLRGRERNADDWAWTLRSAENRPLLRWLEDGSPILIVDGSAETRRGAAGHRRMRLVAAGGERQFGVGPERISMAMQEDVSQRRRMAMSADISPDAAGLMDAMLGFRQEMRGGIADNSIQTLATVMLDPGIARVGGGEQGLEAAAFRTWESLHLMENLDAEAGSDQVMARLGDGEAIYAALPFARVTVHRGTGALEYRMASARTGSAGGGGEAGEASEAMPGEWLPVLSERDGELMLEHGLHQELGWSSSAGPAEMLVVFYGDSIENPMIEGSGRFADGEDSGQDSGQWLLDRTSGMVHTAGPSYSTTGMLASLSSRLPGGNRVWLSYASGDALVMPAATAPQSIAAILRGAHAHRAQMYSLALAGTVERLGARWRASYRWQPDSTVTEVAPFAVNASEPYLNVYIRQPIRTSRAGNGGVEAQLDLRNLLSEGYETFVTTDGSHLYFAQAQRSIRGGLAFTF